ncbi:hypothetical protein [Vreelandella massiliensis]|uniref:hypothetical protein n=1 Tax=Vreelandella massiliensis TaxID=1816686 RepID=UPI00096AB652|nr:hypothetical protein [Halomonas massiliensis]
MDKRNLEQVIVSDGDTVFRKDGSSVRTIRDSGSDTPETAFTFEPGGYQATLYAKGRLSPGASFGGVEGTTYGREVRGIYTEDGTRLSDELISRGLASSTNFGGDTTPQDMSRLTNLANEFERLGGEGEIDELQASARRSRLARLDSLIGGQYKGRLSQGGVETPYGTEGPLSDAWDRGKAELRLTGNAFLQAVGSFTGHDPLERHGEQGVREALADAVSNPARVSGIDEVDGFADAGLYAIETLGAEMPSLLVDAGAALAGAATGGGSLMLAGIGKAALRKLGGPLAAGSARGISRDAASRGAKLGAFGSMQVQSTGESYNEQLGIGVDDPGRAFVLGGVKTAFDYASLKGILGDVTKRFEGGESVDSIAKWFGSTLGAVATGGGREGVTEMTQTLIDELNKVDLTGGEYKVDTDQLIESLAAGSTVGGTLSGTGAAAGNTFQYFRGTDTEAGAGVENPETDAEPPSNLDATIESRPDTITYISPSNVKDGVTLRYLQEKYPNLHGKRTKNGGYKVSTSSEAVAKASTAVDEATMASELGYDQNKTEALNESEQGAELFADQELDEQGRVIRDQVSTRPEPAPIKMGGQARSGQRTTQRRVPVEQARAERAEQYRREVEELRAGQVNRGTNDAAQVEDYETPAQRREAARFQFREERPPSDVTPLIQEARDLGIDTEPFVGSREAVNENVLRRDLQSRINDVVPGRNATLRDALGGERLSDLDASRLRQVAEAMGIKDLPEKARAFRGTPQEQRGQRNRAISAVADKVLAWRDGTRYDRGRDGTKEGRFVDQLAPSDVSLMAGLVPGLEGLNRNHYDNAAEYQTAVRDALNEAFPSQAALRQYLSGLNDAELLEASQLTRADSRGFEFDAETEERADVSQLQQVVQAERQGETSSADDQWDSEVTNAEPFDFDPTPFLESEGERAQEDIQETAAANEAPDPKQREALTSAATAAVYSELTGQTEGAGYNAAVDATAPSLSGDERARISSGQFDGRRLLAHLVPSGDPGAIDQLTQSALDSPSNFASILANTFERRRTPLDAFIRDSTADGIARQETAAASGFPNTRLQDRSEQESSDFLFFGTMLEGARFARDENGDVFPATSMALSDDPTTRRRQLSSPKYQQQIESSERASRLEGKNLVSLTITTRNGARAPYLFDAVAMSEYGQAGERKPDSALDAYSNLRDNLSRMLRGPAAAASQPGGENPTFIQGMGELPFIPEHKVIWEGTSGPVTYGEARKMYFQERSDNQLRADLARELDSINERQSDRRRGLRALVGRMLNGLGQLEGEARLATIRDLNDALYQTDDDALVADVVGAVESLDPAEQGVFKERAQTQLAAREKGLAQAKRDYDKATAHAEQAMAEVSVAERLGDETTMADARMALDKAREQENEAEGLLLRRTQALQHVRAMAEGFRDADDAPDLRGIDTNKSVAGRYSLTQQQVSKLPGAQGVRNFNTLLSEYRRERDRATSVSRELNKIGRLKSYTERSLDELARQLEAEGYDRETARDKASELHETFWGLAGSEAEGRVGDDENPADFDVGGQPMVAAVDQDGNQYAAPVPTDEQSDNFQDGERDSRDETQQADETAKTRFEGLRYKRQMREQLAARVAAFKEATGQVEQVENAELAPDTPVKRSTMFNLYYAGVTQDALPVSLKGVQPSFASESHKLAYQKMQAAKRVQGHGITTQETTRPEILHAAFGDKGMRVIGAEDSSAVESFVSQAVEDFRSTGRPVMVTVGENADQIGANLDKHSLLSKKQRDRIADQLWHAHAGERPMYMPMGDFVLVSLPAQPKRGVAATTRWYHQLGHELGHMVFDDYAQALSNNHAQREAVYAAFEAQTETRPEKDPALFKEWFADQAANEMIDRALGMADPEQMTPFTRLANLLRGLWERIQYLLPRYTRTRAFSQFAQAIRTQQKQSLAYQTRTNSRDGKKYDTVSFDSYRRGEQPIRPQRGPQSTRDFTLEFYDGSPEANQAKLLNTRAKNFVKKSTAPGTVAEAVGRLGRTVVGRLESYSPELASHLFQRNATDRNVEGIQAYDQMANAKRDQWVGVMERAFGEVYKAAGIKGVFKGKAKQDAVIEAFRDFEAGRTHKRGAAALARAMKAMTDNARQSGFRSSILDGNNPPVAFDHHKVDAERQAFDELMREAFPEATDTERAKRLELLLDSHGQSEFSIAPGLPVSYHDTTRHMVDALGVARLRELGFLAEPSDAVFYHFIDGLAKRTAWEANFGGHTDQIANRQAHHRNVLGVDDPNGTQMEQMGFLKDGRYYNPNGKFHQMMDVVVAEHGQAAREDILKMLDGVMGRTTSAMPNGLRNINDWVTAFTSWTILAFSGIASIPEVGLPAVRAHGRAGMIDGVRGYREAREFAKAAGNVLSDSAERIMWQTMGDNYESSTLNKIGTAFFKLNGQTAMTNVSRIMGISIGTQYLLRSAEVGDTQALEQLGVTAEDVRNWDSDGRPVWTPEADTASNATAEKVQNALTQFMYEGSSYPSKFQNPSWFNNPYFKMFWMVKRYMYAYGEGILLGMWRQAKRQWVRGQGLSAEKKAFLAAAPFMAFAVATIPLAAAGTEIREWMRPVTTGREGKDIEDYGGVAKYSQYLFSRAGGFGPLEMVLSMKQQSDWGRSPIGSVSPVIGKAEMLTDWGADGEWSSGEAATKLRQMVPVASQFPGVVNKIFD